MEITCEDFPEHQCPRCGSHSIECKGVCTIALYQDEKHKFFHLLEFDGVYENSRCRCLACGKSGRLDAWIVEGEEQ